MFRRRSVGRVVVAAVGFSLLVAFTAPAMSSPAPAWSKDVPMNVRTGSVAVDREGNSYVTGDRGADAPIAVLKKFDPDGAVVWTRTWSPAGWRTHASGDLVAVAPDGSVYMAGTASSHYEGGGWFLRKYTSDGALLWVRDERGWEHGRAADSPMGLTVSRDLVLLAGSHYGCCGDYRDRDGWTLAFGPEGSWRWRSPFEAIALGGFNDEADGIAVGASGAIYVAGWVALGPEMEEIVAPHELFIQELDREGRVVWSRTYPAIAHRGQDFRVDVAVRGRALMVSALVDGAPVDQAWARPGHAWLGSFTLDGVLRWSREWGTSWTAAAEPTAVSTGSGGRTFVVGTRRDPSDHGLNAFVRAYAPSGRLIWTMSLSEGQRRLEGADVAWGAGDLFTTAEAMGKRFGPGLRGYLWKFADA